MGLSQKKNRRGTAIPTAVKVSVETERAAIMPHAGAAGLFESEKYRATLYAIGKQLPEIVARGLVATTAYGELTLEPGECRAVCRAIEKALERRLRRLAKLEGGAA